MLDREKDEPLTRSLRRYGPDAARQGADSEELRRRSENITVAARAYIPSTSTNCAVAAPARTFFAAWYS